MLTGTLYQPPFPLMIDPQFRGRLGRGNAALGQPKEQTMTTQIIEGLPAYVSAEEVATLATTQAEYHEGRAAELRAAGLTTKADWHEQWATRLRFLADHTRHGATYKLTTSDLATLGVVTFPDRK